MSQIVVSEGPWSGFHRYVIPSREGPPYLSDGEGNLLTLLNWRPAGASMAEGVLKIREETPLVDVFFDEKGSMTKEFGIYVDWQERPCEGCEKILWRTVESTDLGMTWKVTDWGIIDEARLPPEAELPLKGSDYYYDVEIEKILPLSPDAPLSLGYKHRYLDFFSKNNRSIATTNCPEKGQPVSREKGTLICTDSRSIDRYFVGREGYKPEWTALDFSKDQIKRLKRKMGLDTN
ncbi:MAG: hypothetical protein KZQ94_22505 [Candidatus Thiodiazotropha sp. (ex Troendleina suluensis)]|nr:hypothetical protein [Candidatus Thiodiazotropha sp. (ex Troendleina suluensis)]